jgi:hypothetical protein
MWLDVRNTKKIILNFSEGPMFWRDQKRIKTLKNPSMVQQRFKFGRENNEVQS